jgi:hypothetical protein
MNDNEKLELTYLMLDGKAQRTCTGCAKYLHGLGMVKVAVATNDGNITVYEIAEPHTLEDMRAAVKGRHP